jgi:hypothetical protein
MKVVSGGGTSSINVLRGVSGSIPSAHQAGSKVYFACDYEDIVISPVDNSGSDESGWITLAMTEAGLNSALPGRPLSIGNKRFDETITFWRRYTVPPGTAAQNKTDIKLSITGTEHPI